MKTFSQTFSRSGRACRCFALLAALLLALAPSGVRAEAVYAFSQQQLEQMLAPVALYPDALLSQVLIAASFPADVVEAARWSREHADLLGEAAVAAAENEDWDPSVRSLLAFPQLLEYLRDNLQWTQALGDAFLAQQAQVMEAVQVLRRKAQAAGSLRSDDRLSVIESGPDLLLQPVDPQIVYVPYYDPLLAYGSSTRTAYPPVYLRPSPGYYARPTHAGLFHWGPPVGVSAAFFLHGIDWPRRQVRVMQINTHYHRTTIPQAKARPQPGANRPSPWRSEPDWRSGPAYGGAGTPQLFGAVAPPPAGRIGAEARGGRSGRTEVRRESGPSSDNASETRIRPQLPTGRQAPRRDAGARVEVPRAPEARVALRPAAGAAPQRPVSVAATRLQPGARHQAAAANAPVAATRPVQVAAPPDPAARAGARPGMRP